MDKILILNLVMISLAIGALVLLWVKGKKEIVKKIIGELVIFAENKYMKGENDAKYNAVLDAIVSIMNQFWIFKLFLTRNKLKKWIEEAVDYMQVLMGTSSERENTVKNIAIEFAKTKVQELAEKAVNTEYEGNMNLTDNKTIIDLNDEITKKIHVDFEGVYAKLKTGFNKNNTFGELGIFKRF